MPGSSRFAVAVHVLALMAYYEGEAVKSDDLACSVNTNPVVIRRILCALSKAHLVTSQTGATGGSKLARRPEGITLLEVYRAVESEMMFSRHRQRPDRHCPVGRNIESALEHVFDKVDVGLQQVLSKISVQDVLARMGSNKTAKRSR
ncbi:MAG: Rrf2 family transcriptional regulator [Blastocatellia bacterium]